MPELATFANGVMARYLDGNDAFPGGGGHPSDVIAPMFALADTFGCSGGATIAAIAIGYDVHYALFHALLFSTRGWTIRFTPPLPPQRQQQNSSP